MQFPGVVLDRLALITAPAGPAAERRLRAMALLGPLISLYTGRYRLNVEAQKGGLMALSARTRIQVRFATCKGVVPGCFCLIHHQKSNSHTHNDFYFTCKCGLLAAASMRLCASAMWLDNLFNMQDDSAT